MLLGWGNLSREHAHLGRLPKTTSKALSELWWGHILHRLLVLVELGVHIEA